ncbi:hypothetical protein JOY44_06900 [Phormidium sp. CLA17]|uniref:hypothetical protein n=1 Tax=Leptolyngbya sp. Cla-17 TaxID=2803751 RepID=UPI001490BEEC|nr:hypothetical protein [Leptolyngbya sp. Cla-17]MBM0741348.1 hypothetical protein [Leptolyngbya sp. Cla-17]
MSSSQRVSVISSVGSRKGRFRKPNSKELDLLLLAGCSCLMTILYHPVAEALQTAQTSASSTAIATTTSKTATNAMNSFHLIAQASRDKNQDEEET